MLNELDGQIYEVTRLIQDRENQKQQMINQVKQLDLEMIQLVEEETRIKGKQLEKREFIQQIGKSIIETDERMSNLKQKIKLYEDDIEILNIQIEEKNSEKLAKEKILRGIKTRFEEI